MTTTAANYEEADQNKTIDKNSSLSFESLSFKVGSGRKEKLILDDISGHVKCGQMVSVMGPSGAGKVRLKNAIIITIYFHSFCKDLHFSLCNDFFQKTTLLNMLSLRATYGANCGKLLLNEKPLDSDIFKKECFFVGQHDNNWPHLTVCETCTFAARLFGVVKNNHIAKAVIDVLEEVGLTDASNTRNSKLSGGQQRRLSLAIALLKKPTVLFLDELTSGLDSASADRVCKRLRRIVDEEDIIVICTIHQPSTKIFLECFNQLILLSKGRVVYAGGTRSAEDYFASLGHPIPAMTNPSEHYLELVNSDFGGTEAIEQLLDTWCQRTTETNALMDMGQSQNMYDLSSLQDCEVTENSFFCETQILLRRHFLMVCRDVSFLNTGAFVSMDAPLLSNANHPFF